MGSILSLVILGVAGHDHLLRSGCVVSKHKIVGAKDAIAGVLLRLGLLVLRRDKVILAWGMRSNSASALMLSASCFRIQRNCPRHVGALSRHWALAATDLPLRLLGTAG